MAQGSIMQQITYVLLAASPVAGWAGVKLGQLHARRHHHHRGK